jgi:kynurenine 3-monooxygenase
VSVITIVGGGPVGTLLALLLAKRGRHVAVYERRGDPRVAAPERGRSINLALAARGLRALAAADALPTLQPLMTAMPGRILHDEHGATRFVAYGQHPDEVNWSISRAQLSRALITLAAAQEGVSLHFDQRCIDADPDSGMLQFHDERSGAQHEVRATTVIATDGAGSAVRRALAQRQRCQATEDPLAHDYKELSIPARDDGGYRMEPHGLHIWPRGEFMFIALPNADGSFTATLFMPRNGPVSFASLTDGAAVRAFFAAQFPDTLALIPDLETQFAQHPQGALATLYCWPWHTGNMLLVGDAAHAIVPFHGQGLNCGFEDCLLLDRLLAQHDTSAAAFREYENERRRDTDAIAQMALENYLEMRDSVRRPDFAQRRALALELERLHPRQFIPRYSMVMFHPAIGYAEALHRGQTQERVLDALLAEGVAADSSRAATLVSEAGL